MVYGTQSTTYTVPVTLDPDFCRSFNQENLPIGQSMMEGLLPLTPFFPSLMSRPDRVLSRKLGFILISQPAIGVPVLQVGTGRVSIVEVNSKVRLTVPPAVGIVQREYRYYRRV